MKEHINHTLILKVKDACSAHITDWANRIPKNVGAFYIQNECL